MSKHANDLYEAERLFYVRGFVTRFADIDAAHAFLEYVLSTRWFINRWHDFAVNGVYLKTGKYQCGWYDPSERLIILPVWALTDFTLLHELAHGASGDAERGEDHSLPFRQTHVQLVRRFIGADAARSYRHALLAMDLEV